jgi:hypothetical protein
MEKLKEVAHLSGKPGLYKILKPTRTGVIVETLDAKKEKTVISGNSRVSVLHEISVFMADHQESSKPLPEIMEVLKTKYPTGLDQPVKELSEQKLIERFLEIEPDFDRDRVYPSDIKKIFNWYELLLKQWPEALESTEKEASEPLNK